MGQELSLSELVLSGGVRAIAVELFDAAIFPTRDPHSRFVGKQREAQGRGVRAHTGTQVKAGVVKMIAVASRTALTAGFEASRIGVAKVPAPAALQQVAADSRHIPDLWRRQVTCRCSHSSTVTLGLSVLALESIRGSG